MESRSERIVLETESHRIVGDLLLPRDGHLSRLSDFLNRQDCRFVSLTDAVLQPHGGKPERLSFVAVALGHVRLAHPEHEPAEDG